MSRYQEAEPLLRRSLQGYEAAHGVSHGNTLLSCINLGRLLRDVVRHNEAAPLLWRAQKVCARARATE
eukprot:3483884-Prymnesium_polylepis.1